MENTETRRATRLDRAIYCNDWRFMFPAAMARHLTHAYSDYCPTLVDLHGEEPAKLGERPFKLQAAWFLHAEFQSMLWREWGGLPHVLVEMSS